LAWIREKEQIAASTNRKSPTIQSFIKVWFIGGRDLIGVQNLIIKQKGLIAEINNHEPHHEQVHFSSLNAQHKT
jgi:hypothetical protein